MAVSTASGSIGIDSRTQQHRQQRQPHGQAHRAAKRHHCVMSGLAARTCRTYSNNEMDDGIRFSNTQSPKPKRQSIYVNSAYSNGPALRSQCISEHRQRGESALSKLGSALTKLGLLLLCEKNTARINSEQCCSRRRYQVHSLTINT